MLTSGRYVGAEAIEGDEAFAAEMQRLTGTMGEQTAKGAELDWTMVAICDNIVFIAA